ncbi:phosphoglycerate dehydrogenase-like enzyme [Novosphingobium sp. PhB165]|uniref:NAD(P)-dependent oxidoreductase n=1 Tax=Novosphingobium sp. PhB165 TaxID=2485105 RepID=UPI00104D4EDE|nr:NAD(P)-dependent oxidoreductase [Novosphingobium sp. PhB165]TCM14201.1 phosphoglycerate dehydrogenase-like enzyme [Novosphingobium sp. PhB165]
MSLVIASQLDRDFNEGLARHPSRPTIVGVAEEEPWAAAHDADVLLVVPSPTWKRRPAPRPDIWPGRLKWVYSGSAGIDFYPDWLLDAPLVTCGRGVASDEIADYVIAAIYAQAKDLEAATVRSRDDWGPRVLGQVSGTTIGIVGLGAIGTAVALRGAALGAHVIAVRRSGVEPGIAGVELVPSLAELASRSDHIVLALPATSETRALVGAEFLSHVRPHAHLINVARGSVVDQEALLDALDAGRLGFATLDVTEPEPLPAGHRLYTHPCVRLTPHISSNYLRVRHRLLEKVHEDLSRYLRGEQPRDVVDRDRGY